MATPAPDLNIPKSSVTVKVSLMTAGTVSLPSKIFVEPEVPGHENLNAPAFSFLIEHPTNNEKILFDLGVIKDWRRLPESTVDVVDKNGWKIEVKQDVPEHLKEQGIELSEISSIIWSHPHFDHTGDPAAFPESVKLVVGDNFKERFIPGWPVNPDSKVLQSAFEGREVVETDFTTGLKLGKFRASDYFGDGSFYLLDSPGHTHSHMCGLARTTPDTFIFMGGDICHHGGEFRPTEYLPLPEEISPDPRQPVPKKSAPLTVCPGSIYEALHPFQSKKRPFYNITKNMPDDLDQANESVQKLFEFDANDDVLVLIAHDSSIVDILPFIPLTLNDWKEKGLKVDGRWRFLGDFKPQ